MAAELMDCVDALVLVLDARFGIIEANRTAVILLGYPTADLLAKSLPALIDASERQRMTEIARDAEERRGGRTIFLTRSNGKIPVRFSLTPLVSASEGKLGYLLVGYSLLATSVPPNVDPTNGLMARMLKGFLDPVFIIDGLSRTVYNCNEAALAISGFSREELLGKRLSCCTRCDEERQRNQALEARIDEAYATTGVFQERILFPRKDAPPLPCDLTTLPFFKPDGSLSVIIVMLLDRSAEEEREGELVGLVKQACELAAQLNAAVSDYSIRGKRTQLSELGFTARQIEIARFCASGYSSKEIGFRLGIAESTVKNHLAVIYKKLGVNSRIELLRTLARKRIQVD